MVSRELDEHGQPVIAGFNHARRTERDVSELLGLAKGLLADGEVSTAEADLLARWMAIHPDAADRWPLRPLSQRLARIYNDGWVDEDERRELQELLTALVGGDAGMVGWSGASTQLPLDSPPPALVWTGKIYVFTGQMAFGTRRQCEQHVEIFGGACEANVTRRTDYLVIGTFGSRDWAHTSFGRKIQKAVEYRAAGSRLAIVGEDHWAAELPAHVSGDRLAFNRLLTHDGR